MNEIKHFFGGGVYAKQMLLPRNYSAVTHKHKYDHLSILAYGRVVVAVDGKQLIYEAPSCITIEANKEHSILAVEDAVWYCIHATEETDADKVDKVLIKEGE